MALNATDSESEIDVFALAEMLWSKRRIIIISMIFGLLFGLVTGLLTRNEYTAKSMFVPRTGDSKLGGNLGGLASLAGIDLMGASAGSDIPPMLYPRIVSSISFKLALLDAPLMIESIDSAISYRQYYEYVYKRSIPESIGASLQELPGKIKTLLTSNSVSGRETQDFGFIRPSQLESKHISRLDKQLFIQKNDIEGFVQISFVMPDPVLAAQMASYTEELLQKELISFKVTHSEEQLKFIQHRFDEKKFEFEQMQTKLAKFKDRNVLLSTQLSQSELKKLEDDYNVLYGVYMELAKQLEQTKIQVNKETPIFSVIQPVSIPNRKSGPRRALLIVVFLIFFGILSVVGILGNEYLMSMKENRIKNATIKK